MGILFDIRNTVNGISSLTAEKRNENRVPRLVNKTMSIPIRLSRKQVELIKDAATASGENRAEFMRTAALNRAKEIIKENKEKDDGGLKD